MSRFVVGAVALAVALGPLIAGSIALRRRLLPHWTGAPGALAVVLATLTGLLVAIQVLGILGWYRFVPAVLAPAAIGVGLLVLAARLPGRVTEPLDQEPSRLGRLAQLGAVVAASLFAAGWGARTYGSWNHGIVSIDTLWYHLPQAARFAQEGSITGVVHDFRDLSGFYPVASELFHSYGMVVFDNDVLSPAVNLGWGIMALLAAWCIGRPFGLAPVSFTGAAVLLATPGFLTTQPAGAHSDVVGVALILSALALLVTASPRRLTTDPVVLGLAAAPVGIAVGTKWTLLPVAAAVTVGVLVLLARGTRLKLGALWLGVVAALGSFSYVRNLVDAGSPLPSIDLRIGPIGWDSTVREVVGSSNVASHLTTGDAWRDYFLPGLSQWFGYGWWAIAALIVLGLALPLIFGPGVMVRFLAAVGVASGLGYLFGPQLLELHGEPYFFVSNFRYGAVALTLGLVLLPLIPPFQRRSWALLPLAAYLVLLVVIQFDSAIWPVDLRELRMENPVVGADAWSGLVIGLVTLAAGLVLVRRAGVPSTSEAGEAEAPTELGDDLVARVGEAPTRPAWPSVALAAVLLVVFVVGLTGLQAWYDGQRYASPSSPTPFIPSHWRSWTWAKDQDFARIGFVGTNLHYPLTGDDQSNRTVYLDREPGSPNDPLGTLIGTCHEVKQAINERDLTHVALYGYVAPVPADIPDVPPLEAIRPQVTWLEDDPATSVELRGPLEVVFAIDGELDVDRCPPSTGG